MNIFKFKTKYTAGSDEGKNVAGDRVMISKWTSTMVCAVSVALLSAAPAVMASTPASDDACAAAYTGGNYNGQDGDGAGGFGAWQVIPSSNGGSSGAFIGSSQNNGNSCNSGNIDCNTSGNKSFGMYANAGQASGLRTFPGGLVNGQTFRAKMDNGWINGPYSANNVVELQLMNSSGIMRWGIHFRGGAGDYQTFDNNNATFERGTGLGFSDGGITIDFTMTTDNAYSVTITRQAGGSVTQTGNLFGSGKIDRVFVLVRSAGSGCNYDAYFNSFEISNCPGGVPPCTVSQTGGDDSTGSQNTFDAGSGVTSYSWALTANTSGASISGAANGQSVTVNNGTTAGSYTIEVTLNDNGCITTCSETITVTDVDTTPPTVSCPGTYNAQCGLPAVALSIVDFQNQGGIATDNEPGALSIQHLGDTTISGTGCAGDPLVINRVYRIYDVAGNFADCTQVIVLEDTEAPTVTCPAGSSLSCIADLPAADVNAVTASDNCGAVTVIHVGDSESNPGSSCGNTITRTYRATDDCGNFTECTQVFTVDDTTDPVITCAADFAEDGSAGYGAWALGTTSGDSGQNGHFIGDSTGNNQAGDTNADGDIGSTAFGLYANSGNTADALRDFAQLQVGQTFSVDFDNCLIDGGGTVGIGLQNIANANNRFELYFVGGAGNYTISDGSGVLDSGVAFSCEGLSIAVTLNAGDTYTVEITRLVDGSVTTISGRSLGGTASSAIDRFRVFNFNAGSGSGRNVYVNNLSVDRTVRLGCGATAPDVTGSASASDNCGSAAISQSPTAGSALPTGNSSITITATDGCGNTAQCVVDVVVSDTVAPVITCPADANIECDEDSSPANTGSASAVDACDGAVAATFTDSVDAGACDHASTIERTWSATDGSGNTATCVQTIIITDSTAPVVSAPAAISVECDASTDPSATGTATATDNCDSAGGSAPADTAWINEFHYDNSGGDVGEFIEIAGAAGITFGPACEIVLYNGSNGEEYNSVSLDGLTIPDEGCGFGTINIPVSGIQNGGPDGFALAFCAAGTVTEFISYEGSFTAVNGLAAGMTSVDIGVSETSGTPIGQSLQRTGSGDEGADFAWTGPAAESPGSLNAGQTIDPCFTGAGGSLTISHADVTSGTCPTIITRTWSATDACGNVGTADQIITLDDTTGPTLSLPADATVECDGDSSPAATGSATATDSCDASPSVSYVDAVNAGSCPQGSVITRTWTATDACGNSTSADQTITVDDTTDPVVVAPADVTVDCSASTDPSATGSASVTDNCDTLAAPAPADTAWINEFHYDNASGDVGEFIEIAGTAGITFGPACEIVLYNGSNGEQYNTISLNGMTIPDEGCGFGAISVSASGLQNGSPDGIAIAFCAAGTVTEFISYEGSFTAANGLAAGMTSTDIGVSETSSTPIGSSLQRTGSGQAGGDFGWSGPSAESPGSLNVGQTIDPCFAGGGGTLTLTHSDSTSGTCPTIITRTWTGTDGCGNSGSAVQTITVEDVTDPTLSLPADVTVECDASTDPADTGSATATDNCDIAPIVSYVDAVADGACPQASVITRTWTAVDNCGNSVSADQTITVTDSTDPVVVAPADVEVGCTDSIDPSATGSASATDNCDTLSSPAPANTAWINEFHYDNSSGDVGEFIEIAGTAGITFGAACEIVLYNGSNGEQYNTISLDGLTIPDEGCGFGAISVSATGLQNGGPDGIALAFCAAGTVTEFISYEGSFTAVNGLAAGMTSTDIGVSETSSTPIGSSLQRTGSGQAGGDFGWSGPSAESPGSLNVGQTIDPCYVAGGGTMTLSHSDSTAGTCPTVVTRTWTATDGCGNVGTAVQTITIVDNDAPVLTVPAEITVQCDGDTSPGATGSASAVDDCDPVPVIDFEDDIIPGSCAGEYTIERFWTATDVCGNVAEGEQTINVVDTTAPALTVPADITIECDGDTGPAATGDVVIGSPDVCSDAQLCYSFDVDNGATVLDESGNSYDGTVVGATYITDGVSGGAYRFDGNDRIDAGSVFDLGGSIEQMTVSLWVRIDPGTPLNEMAFLSKMQTDVPYTGWMVAQAAVGRAHGWSGLIGVHGAGEYAQSEHHEDINDGAWHHVAATFESTASLMSTRVYVDGVLSMTNYPPHTNTLVGAHSTTVSSVPLWLGMRPNGGIQALIGDLDEVKIFERILTPTEIAQLASDPSGSGSSSDNCGTVTVTYSDAVAAGACDNASTITRTWTATDDCGNSASADQVITIVDTTAPVLTVPGDIEIECDEDSSPAGTGQATANDNCDIPNVTFSDSSAGSCPEVITRTWTAIDACGNSVSEDQIITVNDSTAPVLTVPAEATVECDADNSPAATGSATASDNCDAAPVVEFEDDVTPGACAGQYTIERFWTAVDACGNEAEGEQTINVVDTTAPALSIPADVTIECSDDTSPAGAGQATATDNCGSATVTFSDAVAAGTCDNASTITRTWTATDDCGNSVSADQIITVVDTLAPVVTVPADATIECDEDSSPANTGSATATDNCDIPNVTFSDSASGTCPTVITRTWTATDACGNSASADQTITVEDTTDPVLTLPADATVECDADSSPAATGSATATDNCDAAPVITSSDVVTAGACDSASTITRTWTATDECGNSVSADQVIEVVDTTAPVLTLPADATVECTDPTDPGATGSATATDNCSGNITITSSDSTAAGSCDQESVITRTWTATDDCGNSASADQTILVVDTTAPVVAAPADVTVECTDPTDPSATGTGSVTDNCDTFAVPAPANTAWINEFHYDNASSDVGEFIEIAGTAGITFGAACEIVLYNGSNGEQYNSISLDGLTIPDEGCGFGTISLSLPSNGLQNGSPDGIAMAFCAAGTVTEFISYEGSFTAVDGLAAGMTSTDIGVSETSSTPVGSSLQRVGSGQAGGDFAWAGPSAESPGSLNVGQTIDPCFTGGGGSLTLSYSDSTAGSCPTVITRTWTGTDGCGNVGTADQIITIVDTTAPVLNGVPADATVECDSVPASASVTATDACDAAPVVTFSESTSAGSCADSYTITRTWTATDNCGNSDSESQVITVQDTTGPVLTLPADATVECDGDTSVAANGSATAIDNCASSVTISSSDSVDAGSCPQASVITRTWTATDDCGNSTSADQIINVVDTTAPVIAGPADVTVECDESIDPADTGSASATDNCDAGTPAPADTAWINEFHYDNSGGDVGEFVEVAGTAGITFGAACEIVLYNGNGGAPYATYSLDGLTIPDEGCGFGAISVATPGLQNGGPDGIAIAFCAGGGVVEFISYEGTFTGNGGPADGVASVDVGVSETSGSAIGESLQRTGSGDEGADFAWSGPASDSPGVLNAAQTISPCFTGGGGPAITSSDSISGTCPTIVTRTWTATDGCGNSASVDQVITVVDTTAPVVTVPADATVECDADNSPAATGSATASDNCDAAPVITFSDAVADGACPQESVITRTWTATDNCGNSASADQTLNVVDTTAPVVAAPSDVEVSCDASIDPADTGSATATDNCDSLQTGGTPPQTAWINEFHYDNSGSDVGEFIEVAGTAGITFGAACELILYNGNGGAPYNTISLDGLTIPDEGCGFGAISVSATGLQNGGPDGIAIAFCAAGTVTEFISYEGTFTANGGLADGMTSTDVGVSETSGTAAGQSLQRVGAGEGGVDFAWAGPSTESPGSLNVGQTIDPCYMSGGGTLTITHSDSSAGDCPTIVTRTWTATDGCGNVGTAVQTITVSDDEAPVLTVPSEVTVDCDADSSPAATGSATATDNCDAAPVVEFEDDVTPGACAGSYTIERFWTATDSCGNESEGEQTINVVDNAAPSLSIPADVTVECSDDSSPAATGQATASDNCGTATVTFSDATAAGSCDNESTITRTWTATDDCGNATSADQTITVVDTTAPVLTVPADATIECDTDSSPAGTGSATATDNCDIPNVTFSDAVSGTCPTVITRTWTAVDACGNSSSADQVITVEDTTAPSITVPADVSVECTGDTSPAATGTASGSDNCGSVTITSSDSSVAGCGATETITRTWTATDECGNSTSGDQVITVVDTTAPSLSVPADATIECTSDESSAANGVATGSDTCGSVTITESDSVVAECGNTKTITRTWTATDECGNSTSGDQVITVVDTTAPSLTVPADTTVECTGDTSPASNGTATGSDTCGSVTITSSDSSVVGCGATETITRTWTATDECGNSTSADQVITVVDTTAPSITVPADTTVECTDDESSASNGVATGSDTCGSVTITESDAVVDGCGNSKVITRTWTATDECGNSTSGDQVITVVDTTAPSIVIPADVTIECTADESSAANGVATGSDTCGSVTITESDAVVGSCGNTKTITRTWTATDECGNSTSGDQVITVVDTTAPSLSVPADATIECTSDESSAANGVATGSDTCGSVTITESDSVVAECGNTKTITRTWTATDECGNATSADQVITVVDTTAPSLVVPADTTVECTDDESSASNGVATGSDTCGSVTITESDSVVAECGNTKTITRTWTATDECGNSTSGDQIVTVVDTTAPELIVPADTTVECSEDTSPASNGVATGSDTCGGVAISWNDASAAGCGTSETITRTWTATDDCGNSTSADQIITVVDTIAPVITCPADVEVVCEPGSDDPSVTGSATATDDCDPAVVITYSDEIVGTSCAGDIVRTWTATDACGNSSTCVQTITRTDNTKPVLTGCPEDIVIRPCDAIPAPAVVTALDDCGGVLTVSYTELIVTNRIENTDDNSSNSSDSSDDSDGQGQHTGNTLILRTWTATDACGNSASCSQVITIDNIGNCVLSQGYWKNHVSEWPVTSLTLGCTTYNQTQLLDMLNASVKGDVSVSLAKQLIAALLNIELGACVSAEVQTCIDDAQALLCSSPVYSCPGGQVRKDMTTAAKCLDYFNNGKKGNRKCDTSPNHPPVAMDDIDTTGLNAPVIIDVLANDLDADGDNFVILDVTDPASGTLIVNANGTITYTPNAGFSGSDSFTYLIADGKGGFSSAIVCVFVSPDVPPPPSGTCTDEILSCLARSTVYFDSKSATANSKYVTFEGSVTLADGNLASDFRANANTAEGSIKVTIAGTEVYNNVALPYAVIDSDPVDNKEKWEFTAGSDEKITFLWKDSQAYDASRDPNLPTSVGKLKTRFIHAAETEFRFEWKKSTEKPLLIVVDGIVIAKRDATGAVSSTLPHSKKKKRIDVVYPARLVPGNTISWYEDSDPSDGFQNLIYTHEATSDGISADTYFSAGGMFFVSVPALGLDINSVDKTAVAELTVGEATITLVGCTEFDVDAYSKKGKTWGYNEGCGCGYHDGNSSDDGSSHNSCDDDSSDHNSGHHSRH